MRGLILLVGVAYICDVTIRERFAAAEARAIAKESGKQNTTASTPSRMMLNVGSGSGISSATGPKLRGDVNCDLAAPRNVACGPRTVCYCDAADLSRFGDKQFGVALAANVLSYVPDRARAMAELQRVADVVVISDNALPWPQIGAGSTMVLHGDLT